MRLNECSWLIVEYCVYNKSTHPLFSTNSLSFLVSHQLNPSHRIRPHPSPSPPPSMCLCLELSGSVSLHCRGSFILISRMSGLLTSSLLLFSLTLLRNPTLEAKVTSDIPFIICVSPQWVFGTAAYFHPSHFHLKKGSIRFKPKLCFFMSF